MGFNGERAAFAEMTPEEKEGVRAAVWSYLEWRRTKDSKDKIEAMRLFKEHVSTNVEQPALEDIGILLSQADKEEEYSEEKKIAFRRMLFDCEVDAGVGKRQAYYENISPFSDEQLKDPYR